MTSFDEQLSLSAPPVLSPTRELDAEFVRVVAEAERLTRPFSRRRGRLVIGGLVVLGSLGIGGTVAAAGFLPWYDSAPSRGVVTTSNGSQCTLTFGVKQVEDLARPVTPALRSEAIAAAEKYLKALNFASLGAQATYGARSRPTIDSEAGPAQTIPENDVDSIYQLVSRKLSAHLMKEGLPSSSVGLAMASSCSGDDQ